MQANSTCSYGLSPYPDSTTNALNPCFVSLVSAIQAALFAIIGVVQLVMLRRERRVPSSFRYSSFVKSLSTKHMLHLSNVVLQSFLLLCLLAVAPSYTPYITRWNLLAHMLYVALISLPTEYLQFYKSTAALGGQLFYYLGQALLFGFALGQRIAHYPDERYNIVPGEYGALLEVGLLCNTVAIFFYDLCSYKPSQELLDYYEDEKLYPECNVFANLTFTWMNKLITQTYHDGKIVDPRKMPLPPIDLDIREKTARLGSNWETEKWNERKSLVKAILRSFGKTIFTAIFLETIKDIITVIQPQLLKFFIQHFNQDEIQNYPPLNGFFIALGLFSMSIVRTLLSNQFFIMIFEAGMSIRGALMAMIYEKSLKLSSGAREGKTAGDILNLMSVDVFRIQRFFENSQVMIGSPIQLVIVLISLYSLLGYATIGGLVTMAIMIPINSFLSRKIKGLYKTQMKYKDARIKTITEILNSVKSIKLYAWEDAMLKRLDHVRNDLELANFKKIGIVNNFIIFAWNCVPLMVTCSTFAIFALTMDVPLSPQIVFPALALFNILNDCIYSIPSMITNFIETGVSLNRLKDFLLAEELDESFIEHIPSSDADIPAIEITNATFLWKRVKPVNENQAYDEEESIETTRVALKNINHFEAKKGQFVCIVGRVGSGKSTFLNALLGQLPCISGSVPNAPPRMRVAASSVAYCPQQAWIMNASLKDNIVFGYRFDEQYYKATLKACQLLPDLDILPDGDETLVGEKGISLSGGQKARLSLARAVYARADIYLLDDILSAVDAEVSKNIIDEVLDKKTGLLKNKTVILTTNSIPVLRHCQSIYALENGEIVESGSFEDVMKRDSTSTLKKLVEEFDSNEKSSTSVSDEEIEATEQEEKTEQNIPDVVNTLGTDSSDDIAESVRSLEINGVNLTSLQSRRASVATFKPRPIIDLNADKRKTAQKEENKEEGRVKASVYVAYVKACGVAGVVLFFLFIIFGRVFDLAESFWLKHWAESNARDGKNSNVAFFVGIYAAIAVGSSMFNTLRGIILLVYCSIRGSKKMHDTMARAVLRSPMSFFETTPVGRIINRFSSDINSVDEGLQFMFNFFFYSILNYAATVILIGYNMPWFLVVNGLLIILYLYYQVYYITLSRELKRLMSISISPIMSLLSETLAGHTVINAYKHLDRFDYLNFENVQFNIDCMFNFRSTNRWLSVRLESIGAFLVLTTALLSLATLGTSHPISSGMIGLLMTYALEVTSSLMWIVRMSVQIETNIVSVERIVEYCDLPPEAPPVIQDRRPEDNWPSQGMIKFDHYTTKYRANLDPVLKDINVEIKPQEKIGIVGRTGAGKSTLTLALFRILEPTSGTIIVDGVDISKIGLADLRSNLAIIPQDAQAFEGTVRSNLDPFDQHTDEEIWNALELSHLKPHILKMGGEDDTEDKPENLLLSKITDNGSNLSVGQRQLLCLSRALLNQSKILVLDEATAAVDFETDRFIQETIRGALSDRTILTIAHRIDTVMDSDKIMVLDKGEVKEFDSPANLLANKESIFYNLCEKGGYLNDQKNTQKN
ncbi:LAFE_0D01508g1_1 [Lachancea fermentati]|uniref:LAFE_0D01508g1_1 n=1 Tax=Lachancea fermentati TaxID=4955 RepID=A0A1G4MB14_LACFM|nr:LAFE_0D01508g1_1 [Lachancea fermentati]